MKEIVDSYFKHRSLVNHQLASYNDCIPIGDGKESRMERIVRNIKIGSDEQIDDDEGGMVKLDLLDKEIIVRLKNLRLGRPTIKEANGAEHPATPLECRLRKLTYFSPVYLDFKIFRDDHPPSPGSDLGSIEETSVHIGNLPIMVRSARCNLHPNHLDENRRLSPGTSTEDSERYTQLL